MKFIFIIFLLNNRNIFKCKTCSLQATNCVHCIDGYFYDINHCALCFDPCLTCQSTGSNCTSCNEGSYLIIDPSTIEENKC